MLDSQFSLIYQVPNEFQKRVSSKLVKVVKIMVGFYEKDV